MDRKTERRVVVAAFGAGLLAWLALLAAVAHGDPETQSARCRTDEGRDRGTDDGGNPRYDDAS